MAEYSTLTDASTAVWTQAPAAPEAVIWSVQAGAVLLSTKAAQPSGGDGLLLRPGAPVTIPAGKAVWYRAVDSAAPISREALGMPMASGVISASGQSVAVSVRDAGNVMVAMTAAALVGHNATFEGSLDSTNGADGTWFTLQAIRSNANTVETATGVLAASPAYAWEVSVNAINWMRIRATAHTSGTATYAIQPTATATEPVPAAVVTATQPVSLSALPAIVGQGAEDAGAAGNAVRVGGKVRTSSLTTLVAGDAADVTVGSGGQVIVKKGGLTEQAWNSSLALTTTAVQAVAAAAGAGLKRHITALQAINTGGASNDLILLDGATEVWRLPLPPNVPVVIPFDTHLPVTANAALNVNLSAAGTVRFNAQGYTSP